MKIILFDKDHEVRVLLEATEVLKNGGVVVVPTDTVYGLVADAMRPEAIDAIFKIKLRSEEKPLSVFVSDHDMLDKVAVADKKLKDRIQDIGSITAVLPARGWMPMNLRSGNLTMGVRVSEYPFIKKLLEAFGGPLAQTSANTSGRGPYTRISNVVDEFEGGVEPDLIVDAGDLPESFPSAVIDFTKDPPIILRSGYLPKHALMKLLGNQ